MSEIVARLGKYFSEKNLKTYKVEQQIGVSNGSIGTAIRENRAVGSNVIEKICAHYPINPVWLLTGAGNIDTVPEMPQDVLADDAVEYKTKQNEKKSEPIVLALQELIQEQKRTLADINDKLNLQTQANLFVGEHLQSLINQLAALRSPNTQAFENLALKKEMVRLGLIAPNIVQK
jgi:hypothetical protein